MNPAIIIEAGGTASHGVPLIGMTAGHQSSDIILSYMHHASDGENHGESTVEVEKADQSNTSKTSKASKTATPVPYEAAQYCSDVGPKEPCRPPRGAEVAR